ncbi:MAG TPA: M28 family peptidase, partial [Hyphomonadaceae bacterium]|nr:M28 family peptidase [Hyphomonadaceae bacterium]
MSRRMVAAGAAGLIGLALAGCASSNGQDVIGPGEFKAAWFGLVPPVALADPEIAPPQDANIPPAIVPAGEVDRHGALTGERIRTTVETVVDFAKDMRAAGPQMWGRISGLPSEAVTAQWLGDEFDAMGLTDVKLQSYKATGDFWWPDKWEARVLADPAFGDQTIDVVLSSAIPVSRSMLAAPIEASVIVVGDAGEVSTEGVAGKIAVQHTRPETGAYSDRTKVRESSQKLIQAGAVAVITWVEQAGNMHVFDFGQCGGHCFNVGGADGRFLTEAVRAAKDKGAPDVRMRLMLQARNLTGLAAANVLGIVPGQSDEIIIVNAHLDSWFDGAGDNADGVGVLVGLARYFSNAEAKPARTLLFVGSGGHHSSGMNGPASVVSMNPELMRRVKLVVNLEHLAQFHIEAVPAWKVDPTEEPKNFGVSNSSPFLVNLVKQAAQRYGFVIRPDVTNSVPGDLGGYASLNVARIQGIHSGPLYHTSGDTLESISSAGLEKAARFYAY